MGMILLEVERMNYAKNITIGNKVWLADGVVVLKGILGMVVLLE
jgi:acetyltransferase-like isoleucine patch superfamily enzyme